MKNFIKKHLTFNHCWLKKISKNKTIEVEVYTSPLLFDNLFNISSVNAIFKLSPFI